MINNSSLFYWLYKDNNLWPTRHNLGPNLIIFHIHKTVVDKHSNRLRMSKTGGKKDGLIKDSFNTDSFRDFS